MQLNHDSSAAARSLPYSVVVGLLLLLDVAEWCAYAVRAELPAGADSLVPALLVVTLAKFLLVVAWLVGKVEHVSLAQKVTMVTSALAGGAIICPLMLF
ncbi:MAG: hypothetical protein FJ146_13290 [Deltaproteobacteria bacterium]|nr:hypothetical protein [Deltaproteobacteria bacterium]